MKRILVVAAALIGLLMAGPAWSATDTVAKTKVTKTTTKTVTKTTVVKREVPLAAPVYNWNGFYVGANAGGGFGTARTDFGAYPSTTGDYDIDGAVIGGQLGYNQTFTSTFLAPVWVAGLEGDMDWSDVGGSHICPNPAFTCRAHSDWVSTIRLRAGIPVEGRFLPYITGGLAVGEVTAKTVGAPTNSISNVHLGWTAGAGVEAKLWDGWSVKGEYLFVDLGNANCASCDPTHDVHTPFSYNLLRAGLNYQFDLNALPHWH